MENSVNINTSHILWNYFFKFLLRFLVLCSLTFHKINFFQEILVKSIKQRVEKYEFDFEDTESWFAKYYKCRFN